MKKKILIFKNDRLGDLAHGFSAINNLILNNPDKEIIIFLSKLSKDFFFLFEAKNTRLQILNYQYDQKFHHDLVEFFQHLLHSLTF